MVNTDSLQNILHTFRTYAYHHILVACDSTETCDVLSSSDDVVDFQHPRTANGFEKFTPKTTKSGGKYIVLIDGTTDASLYIQDVTLTNVLISNEKTLDGRPVISSGNISAEMTVVEANGALFLNLLAQASQVFNTSPFGMFFLIKTIFVGYQYDGSLETVTNIVPFMCTIVDTTADFSSAGSSYKLTFAGRQNGFATDPVVSGMMGSIYVGEEISDKSVNGMPLIQVLQAIEKKFNQTQDDVRKKRIESIMTPDELEAFERTYAPIYTKIDTHPDYKNFDYYVEAKDERTQNSSKSFYLEATTTSTVISVVESTLKMCRKILEEQILGENLYEPKVNANIITKPNLSNGMLIDIYVDKIPKPKVQRSSDGTYLLSGVDDSEILKLNYVFTGKNVDILDFNMTMQFGNAFLMNMPVASSIAPPADASASVSNVLPANGATTRASTATGPTRTPHNQTGGQSVNPFIRNTRDPLLTSKFYAALAQHSQFESIGVRLKIAGNPRFMGILDTNKVSRPYEYVKINIMMPDPTIKEEHAPIPFWFDGVYRVLEYTSNFEGGMFTQELTLNVVPADTPLIPEQNKSNIGNTQQGMRDLPSAIEPGQSTQQPPIPPPVEATPNPSTKVTFIPPEAPRQTNELGDMRKVEYTLNRQK